VGPLASFAVAVGSSGRLTASSSSSYSKYRITDEDDDEDALDPAVPGGSEIAGRFDALFSTGEDARLQITYVARRKEGTILASRRDFENTKKRKEDVPKTLEIKPEP
jgi:hypothetical protein